MAGRFSAFSFVDRILAHAPGATVRGRYTVPPRATRFPASLAAEAIGQLAAWVAMHALDFRVRPVAGLAGETRFGRAFGPGDTLELEVDLENATESDVAYHGRARVDGEPVMVLEHALGPMLPAADFDDPGALRADFATLAGPGAPAGRFEGVAPPALAVEDLDPGRRARGTLAIPADAPYFADHFPRKPVFPATLLMDALGILATRVAGEGARVAAMQDVKVRAFMPPGESLAVSADLAAEDGSLIGRVVAKMRGKPVATARVILERP
ncbi:3-hydroxyacyl-[acyl-carrier-protein] dehydratase FabZ [Burkholderiales bacterium]|nr:3-hydroxyacyl-[acyl-carrier-protein] dehydratase FabZ [Burkholderiales bacterium]